jgi:hypothetical protein
MYNVHLHIKKTNEKKNQEKMEQIEGRSKEHRKSKKFGVK